MIYRKMSLLLLVISVVTTVFGATGIAPKKWTRD
jgi:uncharacterized membrane protein YtjA (UPF0391 family)